MKNINFKIPDFSTFKVNFIQSTTYLFWGVFLVLLIWELVIARNSVSIIFSHNNNEAVPVQPTQDVRINFDAYNKAVQRITQAATYEPDVATSTDSPFQPPPH